MRPGKLSQGELERIVFPRHGVRRDDVFVRAGIGLDSAAVRFGDELAVLSTDPITGAGADAGWLAVHVGCNDVAASGAQPVAVLVTLLLSPGSALNDAAIIMADAHRAAGELGIEIVGGHTEITVDLSRSIVVVTALGRCRQDRLVRAERAHPGDAILMTKWAGLEGTAILARDYATHLRQHLPEQIIERAQTFMEHISVVSEALSAASAGASAMHDATEGGILGALAELAVATGHGVDVDIELIPVRGETQTICADLRIDPLALVSSGTLLIATPTPAAAIDAVSSVGSQIMQIGRLVDGPSVLHSGRKLGPLVAPDRDALWDAIERLQSRRDNNS